MRIPRAALVTACAATVVTVAGLLAALSQRPSNQDTGQSAADSELRCGSSVCRSVIGRSAGPDMVELLSGTNGARIRVSGGSGTYIFESTVAEAGAQVTADSLQCVSAKIGVCLVRGPLDGDVLGEVLVGRDGTWTRAQAPYLSNGAYLGLHDVDGDGAADVVAVQQACDGQCDRVYVQVFSPVGADLGCTTAVNSRDEANLTPARSQLRPCSEA